VPGVYRELDPDQIIATAEALTKRVGERFPGSGLSRVTLDLLDLARDTKKRAERLRRPIWPVRVLVGAGILLLVGVAVAAVVAVQPKIASPGLFELLQGLESAVNDLVFIGVAVFFLATIETRLKRRTALDALHELRSVAHIVDMHQLTKDPEIVTSGSKATASSPKRTMSRFELARYLDYCSESLSLASKLAALHVQHFNDPDVLDSVEGVQTLTQGLSVKIWQKIMILNVSLSRGAAD
jgi:hypothetical protein